MAMSTVLRKALAGRRRKAGSAALFCSFCGKSQHEVRKLISGPGIYICEECVALCNEILASQASLEADAAWRPLQAMPDEPRSGGAETHLHEVFGRLARRGHEVTALVSGSDFRDLR